jgi:hypothetical protein
LVCKEKDRLLHAHVQVRALAAEEAAAAEAQSQYPISWWAAVSVLLDAMKVKGSRKLSSGRACQSRETSVPDVVCGMQSRS